MQHMRLDDHELSTTLNTTLFLCKYSNSQTISHPEFLIFGVCSEDFQNEFYQAIERSVPPWEAVYR